MWEAGFEGSVYKFKNKGSFDSGMAMIKNKIADEQMAKEMNTQSAPDRVSIQRGRYEFSRYKDATLSELSNNKIKVINPTSNATGPYTVIVAKEVFAGPGQKSLDEARGYVVAEYQDFLEKQWNEKMRHEYPLKVNDKVLKTLVK
jgi:peptidyl-prolyl cis-trans isomerase SurA